MLEPSSTCWTFSPSTVNGLVALTTAVSVRVRVPAASGLFAVLMWAWRGPMVSTSLWSPWLLAVSLGTSVMGRLLCWWAHGEFLCVHIRWWKQAHCPHQTQFCMMGKAVSPLSNCSRRTIWVNYCSVSPETQPRKQAWKPETKVGWAAVRKKCTMKNSLPLISELCQYWSNSLPPEFSKDKYLFVFWLQPACGACGSCFPTWQSLNPLHFVD